MRNLIPLLLPALLCTCAPAQTDDVHPEDAHHAAAGEEDHHDEGIHLTRAQMETMDIRFGDFSQLKVNDFLTATGTLGLPPNAYAMVSARAAGFIRNARNYVEGDYVKKGAVIALLENPDFTDLQRQYLEGEAQLTFLRQELARQQTLTAANAGIEREVQRLTSEVAAGGAAQEALRQRLEYLGIRTEKLTPETITQQITLFAPRSGYITTIILHEGMYVEPSTQLMELIDEENLHLELAVFERDVARLKEGQRVTYRIPALGTRRYEAEVHVIGKEFDSENKTLRVHADLVGEQPTFIRDLFAEARIWLDDRTSDALPEGAIVRDGEFSYVFAAREDAEGEELEFERLRVQPGTTDAGFTSVEMIDPLPPGMRVITENAYFVYAQAMRGEMAHEH